MVELPVEWIRDDAVYFNMNRFQALRPYTPPEAVFDIFRREFDRAYEEGGLFLLTMHPHVITYRSRIWILEELIAHIKAKARCLVRQPCRDRRLREGAGGPLTQGFSGLRPGNRARFQPFSVHHGFSAQAGLIARSETGNGSS